MQRSTTTASVLTVVGLWGALALEAAPAAAQQYDVSGADVAIFNLAGEVRIQRGAGDAVRITVTRGGNDAERLTVERGPIDGRETLRIIYPSDRISYDRLGYGETTIRVREDGTFGDHDNWRRFGGDRVTISGRGRGLDAYADLTVAVPRGQRLAVYLGIGQVTVSNVDGDLRVDTSSGPIEADGTTGSLTLDTGSGEVRVRSAEGEVTVDTGSGSVDVSGVRGRSLLVDTGSGSVDATDVEVSELNIDTGSGSVVARNIAARDIRVDTGSGSVDVALIRRADTIVIDTGSGGVTLLVPESFGAEVEIETGSGDIDFDMPVTVRQWGRDHVSGTIGDGAGRLVIDTGSGDIRIRPAT